MQHKGVIIINSFDSSSNNTHKVNRMREEFTLLGVDVDVVKNDVFLSYVGNNGFVNNAKQYEFALFFDKDKYIARMLEQCGVKLFNNSQAIELCDDKMLTHIELAKHKVNMPITLAGALCYKANSVLQADYLQFVENTLGYPMVVKQCYGSYGQQVHLVKDSNQLYDLIDKIKCTPYLFQQYLGKYKGSDIRAIVIGGKLCCAMRRVAEDDFRSNIELGGHGYTVELTEPYIDIAERTAKILNLDYCGVDILTDDNDQPAVCEVNSNAMFQGIERTTGVNVARAFAQHILSKL